MAGKEVVRLPGYVGGIIDVALYKIFGVGFILFLIGVPLTILFLLVSFGTFNGKRIYQSFPVFVKYISTPKQMVFQKERSVSDLNIQPMTIEQIQAITTKNNEKNVVVEPVQTQLKRLSRLLDQKNEEESEITRGGN